MLKDKTFLAIIPARAGSKRLPKKNKLIFANKPLIAWSIEAAKMSKYIDEIVVSSDDKDILAIAQEYDVKSLYRPEELSDDTTSTTDVIQHILKNIKKDFDYIVLLQPTSPLRDHKDINNAIELLIKKDADSIISVCEVGHPPFWSNTLPENKNMNNFLNEDILNKRSQDFKKYYRLNGAIYIIDKNKFLKTKNFFLKQNSFAYEMSQEKSIDIDSKLDFQIASQLFKILKEEA